MGEKAVAVRETDEDAFQRAYELAKKHNMFIVTRTPKYLLYRRTRSGPMFLGHRSDAAELRSLVSRCAKTK